MKFQTTLFLALASILQIVHSNGMPGMSGWEWDFAPSCAVSSRPQISGPHSNNPVAIMPFIRLPHHHFMVESLRNCHRALKLRHIRLHPDGYLAKLCNLLTL